MQALTGRNSAPVAALPQNKSQRLNAPAAVNRCQYIYRYNSCQLHSLPVSQTATYKRSRAAVHAAAQAEAVTSTSGAEDEEWYALVANAEFMLYDVQNESFAEQLREKTRLYQEQGKDIDFFLVSDPAWLDQRFPSEGKRVRRPCVALVCKNKTWATFMKLRLDRVLLLTLGGVPEEELFKSNGPVPEFPPRENWTAPYSPYSKGWWEPFMRNQ